jgi:hypothetical protein
MNPEEHEKRSIAAITGNTITLDSPLAYDHYGDPTITVSNFVGDLDMRAAVGHLTRNIKISGSHDPNMWGCRVLIYQFTEPGAAFASRGYGKFDGVEWDNCG